MATIKPIEAQSVHQIQSGQVIVDLCSVVKELIENSLDANAISVEVRFKNNGLDGIEVQDNGDGISPANYESVALKHHTSKLSTYDDLSKLKTFGFRGEALSSLCALSKFFITTARANEAPKGRKLDFESSGKLKGTTVVASQKGTTACVEGIFEQLPVRRKALSKNIKREYNKVVGLLHAYACVCVGVKFTVKSSMPKGRSATLFATKGNPTTKENIANVYGAKTLSALVPLDLELDFPPSSTQAVQSGGILSKIFVYGHISRPVFGEGRQTPDRQMFFVNSRPCGLPQIAKAFNEIYKSFNMSQSPFIFADFHMDTDAYDVNVSPDKRTILLHDSAALLERLKVKLIELFGRQEQTMPQSQLQTPILPASKQLSVHHEVSRDSTESHRSDLISDMSNRSPSNGKGIDDEEEEEDIAESPNELLHDISRDRTSTRAETEDRKTSIPSKNKQKLVQALTKHAADARSTNECDGVHECGQPDEISQDERAYSLDQVHIEDFNELMAEQRTQYTTGTDNPPTTLEDSAYYKNLGSRIVEPERPNVVQNVFDRMRPKREAPQIATIFIGDKTMTTVLGSRIPKFDNDHEGGPAKNLKQPNRISSLSAGTQQFSESLRGFVAPGSQIHDNVSSYLGDAGESTSGRSNEGEDDPESEPGDISNTPEHEADDEYTVDRNTYESEQSQFHRSQSEDYDADEVKKAEEEAKVEALIRAAESTADSSTDSAKLANRVFKRSTRQDLTVGLCTHINGSLERIEEQLRAWHKTMSATDNENIMPGKSNVTSVETYEDRLSLTVSKSQFASMHIVGQFNLGFILAVRPSSTGASAFTDPNIDGSDQLFIVDQHASDEKYNFERLQMETVVGNQRLVRPMILDLTAVEEEIIMENPEALEKNGFIVEIDTSGEQPIGQRCKLISLPLSKEVIFNTQDLEELIYLLAESPISSVESIVPRPAKVRKMFAMRACRSSIMIGKTLSEKQMLGILRHMGEIDKPWNCPHGRPTIRHLMSLDDFGTWQEEDVRADVSSPGLTEANVWGQYGH